MELSYDTIWALAERYPNNIYDDCHEYGEPGYNFDHDGPTQIILSGDWWCRCGNNPHAGKPKGGDRVTEPGDLHDICSHHPRVWAQLESQGVDLVWYDEWAIDYETGKAYRTTGDSYSWRPSAIRDDHGELMTPDTDIEVWLEWLLEWPTARFLPTNIYSASDLEAIGFFRWPDEDESDFESGWHPGQTDDPVKIAERIADTHPEHDVVFVLTENSQFYCRFAAYIRPENYEEAAA